MLGRKTLEIEILNEAGKRSQLQKTDSAAEQFGKKYFAMSADDKTLGVSHSNLPEDFKRTKHPRGAINKEKMRLFCQLSGIVVMNARPMATGSLRRWPQPVKPNRVASRHQS